MASKPAARQSDPHACPAHGPSPVLLPCCPTVVINSRFAARVTDMAVCPTGGPDAILFGSASVRIGSLPAARKEARCAHGGTVLEGSPDVVIGNPASNPDGGPVSPECAFLANLLDGATGQNLDRLRDSKTMTGPTVVTASPNGTPGQYRKYITTIRGK